MSKKVSLGTKWAFQEIEDPSGKMAPLYGIDADGTSYRIMPSRNVPGAWNLDVHKKLSGWEDAVSGRTFKTPEEAAKALIKMHAETQSKTSEKNIQAQLRARRPGFYEETNMDSMRQILEQAEVEEIRAIIEADDSACKGKYMDAKTGRFKGGKGERFDNCVKYMTCKGGVDDPEAMCAKIARAKGAAPGGKNEGLDESVGASLVDRMAEAMLRSPKLEVLMTRVFDDESQQQMFDGMITEPLRALIAKALDAAGATVSGGLLAKAGREMKGVARGGMGEAILSELGGQRGSRGRDPYWMTAKYSGKAKDGTPFKKGDRVFYYPSTKTVLAGAAADTAAAEFQGAVDDERLYNQGAEW